MKASDASGTMHWVLTLHSYQLITAGLSLSWNEAALLLKGSSRATCEQAWGGGYAAAACVVRRPMPMHPARVPHPTRSAERKRGRHIAAASECVPQLRSPHLA